MMQVQYSLSMSVLPGHTAGLRRKRYYTVVKQNLWESSINTVKLVNFTMGSLTLLRGHQVTVRKKPLVSDDRTWPLVNTSFSFSPAPSLFTSFPNLVTLPHILSFSIFCIRKMERDLKRLKPSHDWR